jgi:hypothetical protein
MYTYCIHYGYLCNKNLVISQLHNPLKQIYAGSNHPGFFTNRDSSQQA